MTHKEITPDLDEILWAAAESKDPQVQAEFEARYPHLRAQLATRKAMVDVLRDNRPKPHYVPAFRPLPMKTPAFRKLWLVPAAAILLGALAFGAYQVTTLLVTPRRAVQAPIRTGAQLPAIPNNEPPAIRKNPIEIAPTRPQDLGTSKRPEVLPAAKIVSVPTKKLTLIQALEATQQQGGVKIQVMPGVKNEELQVDANRPDGSLALAPAEMLAVLEKAASIRIVDGGPEGYFILPMDKVNNVDTDKRRYDTNPIKN